MVHVVRGVAAAVEPDVAGLDALGVDEPALVGFDVFLVLADAEAGRVVVVVVEDRRHAVDEILVVGDLDDDVPIDAGLAVIVPDEDRADRACVCPEVDLDPLGAGAEFDEIAVLARLFAVRDEAQLADDRLHVARGHGFLEREKLRSLGNVERPARLAGDRLEVRRSDVARRADEHRLGQLEFEFLFVGVLGLGEGDGAGPESRRNWTAAAAMTIFLVMGRTPSGFIAC